MSRFWKIKYAEKAENSYFSKNKYHFFPSSSQNDDYLETYLFEFNITVSENIDILSVINYLQDVDSTLIFLDKYPCRTTDLIQKYDNNIENIYLFHDIKTEYILFVVPEQFKGQNDSIIFIGVTVLNKKIRFSLKTFNIDVVRDVHDVLIDKIGSNVNIIDINYVCNIKWLIVNKYKIFKKKDDRTQLENIILKDSINFNYEKMYRALFSLLIRKGYITSKERTEISKLTTAKGARMRNILKRYLKLPVEEGRATLIQEEIANNLENDDKNSVYTLSASGWKYFMNSWFEDYVGQALKSIKNVKIEYMQQESEFNFKDNNNPKDKIEVDWLILATYKGISKVICIECKRTLSSKILKAIREKYEEKIIKTKNHNVIDGFINVGFFLPRTNKRNFEFNELNIEKISIKSIKKLFITFLADNFQGFCDNLEKAIIYILKEK